MALTHGDALLRETARASFWTSYENYVSVFAGVMANADSNADQETYSWLGYAPTVREMVGGRTKRASPQHTFTIVNKQWENTVAIDYATRKYNKNGAVAAMLGNLGAKARAYPDKLASSLLNSGATAGFTCYDSLVYFSASHVDPGAAYTTVQTNLRPVTVTGDGTLSTAIDTEVAGGVRLGFNQIMSFVDNEGDPVYPGGNFKPLIMCHPLHWGMFHHLQTSLTLTAAAANYLIGTFDLVVNPWLTLPSTNGMAYIINRSSPHKALLLQTAEAVSLEDDLGGDNDFNTKDVSFGSFGYYNVGYGDWRCVVRLDFS